LNRSPTKSVRNKVPQEAWIGMSCSVAHLRVFGCVAYAHVPKELRRKLDERSEKCIFLGYNDQSKAYKLYNLVTKKVIINRDVEFKEDEAWDGSIDMTISVGAAVPQEGDEVEEQIAQGGQQGSQTQSLVIGTPTRTPRNYVQGEPSSPASQSIPNYQSSSESDPTIASLRSRKTRSLRELYEDLDVHSNFALFTYQPTCFEEVVKEEKWVQAMDEEIDSIERNDTWDLVDFPKDKDCIGVKWVYKIKVNEKGEIEKYKARLVEKGFAQQPGVDYGETFAPVARLDIVRVVLAIASQNMWKVIKWM
jgi:hypothetical protein